LWVLDEPFDALDVQGVSALHQLICDHQMRGGSVLLTSHIPLESSTVSVRVLDLNEMVLA